MLYYDKMDVSEGININKTKASKECDTCHYWFFQINGLSLNRMPAYVDVNLMILLVKNKQC